MKIINWFRDNWFLFVILIVLYIILRLTGHDIKIIDVSGLKEKIDY
jgi:hypothetical protein